MRIAVMPPGTKSLAQFHPHSGVVLDIANISRSFTVFRHEPELAAKTAVADRRTTRFPRLAPDRLKQRVSGRYKSDRKQKLDLRIEYVLLQSVNNPVFHGESRPATSMANLILG